MRFARFSLCFICLAALTILGHGTALAAGGALDGKTFVGAMGEVGKPLDEKDEMVFQAGSFHSLACDPWGFGGAPYTATPGAGGAFTFEAETSSAKEGKMRWKGTAKGDQLEGTVLWVKGDQRIQYRFKATLKR